MTSSIRILVFFSFLALGLFVSACSEDDVSSPDDSVRLDVDFIEPESSTLEMEAGPILFKVGANLPLLKVTFSVDGEIVAVDTEEPFLYLWDIACWADGESHSIYASGEASDGQIDGSGRRGTIREGVGGVHVQPQANGGLPDEATGDLIWRADPHAAGYEVQVSLSREFDVLVSSSATTDTAQTAAISPGEWQYWRVRPQFSDDSFGPWSTTAAFYAGMVFDHEWEDLIPDGRLGWAVRQTEDKGFLVAGTTGSQPFLMRTNPFGEVLWSQDTNSRGYFKEMVLLDDGGCVLAGINEFSGNTNIALTRYDSEGGLIWNRPWFGSEENDEIGEFKVVLAGGYVMTGELRSQINDPGEIWLLRTDEDGRLLWEGLYGVGAGAAVLATVDGEFFIAGHSGVYGCLLLIDSMGQEVWRIDLPGYHTKLTHLVEQAGQVVTLDETGRLRFFDTQGTQLSEVYVGSARSLFALADGGFILGSGSNGDAWLHRLDASGAELWSRQYGDELETGPFSVRETTDGGFVFTGMIQGMGTRIWLVKTDPEGNLVPPADE